MQTIYDKLRENGLVVLAINEVEDEAKVREHIKQHGHTFPVFMDRDNNVANQFGVFGLPVSIFIDEKGMVREYMKSGLFPLKGYTLVETEHDGPCIISFSTPSAEIRKIIAIVEPTRISGHWLSKPHTLAAASNTPPFAMISLREQIHVDLILMSSCR
jgi:hypothetical protein